MTRAHLPRWAQAILVALLTLTLTTAPGQHTRVMLAQLSRAVAPAQAVAGAMPTAHHHERTPGVPHGGHLSAPACDACVLMAAPGLAAGPFAAPTPRAWRRGAAPAPRGARLLPAVARAGRHARAPPNRLLA